MPSRVATVTAELRADSAAVASPTPRLSWTVSSSEPGWRQAWAELRRGTEVVRREGRDSVLVDWPFAPLSAGERAEVRVRAGSTDGDETPWSNPLHLWAAFAEEWVAKPIALADPEGPAQPAMLRTSFVVDRPVRTASLHWTALGVVDASLNGSPVDDLVLTPGWTSYRERLVYETADVTALVREGENALGLSLAGGWYTEEYHVLTAPKRFYGDQPRALAQLRIEFEDGSFRTVATGDGWRASGDGPIVASGIYAGEQVDARRGVAGWDAPGFDDAAWAAASVVDEPLPTLEPRMAPPVREIERMPPVAVSRTASGRVLLDFGQNLVGRLRLRVRGPRGTVVTVRHAEVLEGAFDEGAELALRPLRRASATDTFTLSGASTGSATSEEMFEPRFTFHGFRYVDIDGWPGEFDPTEFLNGAVEAVVLGSDLTRTGWFEASDPLLNRFHENVVWTLRGNYLAVPQDCPQRDERLGWTGDTQLFAPTAEFLFDCHAFLRSWLRDLALEQRRLGGLVPLFAPDVLPGFSDRGPVAAWGDAIAIVPHVLADSSGDISVLAEFYPGMRDWIDLVLSHRDAEGLWTSGRQLADWLDPNAPPNAPSRGRTDTDIVATAYLVRTTRLTADVARRLGHHAEADRLLAEAEASRRAYLDAFVTPTGRMMCDTQTAYALTIAFDLVDDRRLRQRVGDRLAFVVRRDGYRIATGLVGTAVIAQALTATGHLEAAERLLFQTESPSWLYPVTVGATTVWERWDGLRPDGSLNPGAMISFNHVALGSVAAWLHAEIAGLSAAEPGYRVVRIAPKPLARLSLARARHNTPYGPAESGWERIDGGLRVFAEIPTNTTGLVDLPDGRRFEVGAGVHEWTVAETDAASPRPPVTLESSMAELADDPAAHRAFFGALTARPNRFLAGAVSSNALYTPGRSIRDALVFADDATLAAAADALATAHDVKGTS
ncbi:alpha-L-rhamnosidase [Microbacterium trichothecenolyticum]|uniref:family 78 glycoside hydrolase catalytic domain n=1 Tax=Microbacterium trichothecenolyticum TaxID=69370 RepID=UPI00285AC4E6|nr:family 78 glycoside hydrolase catalytic domain [Microbacterium trichothecenolyticum]MDR7184338.1 alpha-L-rhamnosidase [Microbacterium trichothecenolyticum]